jgi:biopolymer transport protein ExbB
MNITQRFLSFALLGAAWVMWLLVGLSVVSIAIMIERWRFFFSTRIDGRAVADQFAKDLATGDLEGAYKKLAATKGVVEAAVVGAGIERAKDGAESASSAMDAARAVHRSALDRNLAFLGTVGNNAPFVGLFGTVIGIIKAFHDLAQNTQGGASTVMAGISEALVATAIGILVAIPAVAAFNYFQRKIKAVQANLDALSLVLVSHLQGKKG